MDILTQKLTQSFQSNFRLDLIRPNMYQLFLPVYYPDGDMVDIFINTEKNGSLCICDCGLTLMRLSYTYDLNSDYKMKIFANILRENGAEFENGNIYIYASAEDPYPVIMQFVQLIAQISDMKHYQKMTNKSEFYHIAGEYIMDFFSHLPTMHMETDISPLPNIREITVDYALQGAAGRRPVYLFPVQGDAKAKDVIIALTTFQKEQLAFTGVIIHDRFNELTRKTQKLITNTADKQFYDLDSFQNYGKGYITRLLA